MKQIAIAAVALVLGLIIGGLQPRAALRALEQQVQEAQASDRECRSTLGKDLAALMSAGRAPRGDRNPLGDRPPEVIAAEHPESVQIVEELDAQGDPGTNLADGINSIDPEQLEIARSALELRRSQARAALLEDAQPDERQIEDLDAAVQTMNTRLMGMAEELATIIESGREPSRRDAMEFAADALDTMLAAEFSMRSALDPDQLATLDDSVLDPFSFVDPELVTVLQSLGSPE